MADITSLSELREIVRDVYRHYNETGAITASAKDAMVVSQVFIDNKLKEEKNLHGILSHLLDLYVGYIVCVLSLNTMMSGTRTVRDSMRPVATEGFKDTVEEINKLFALSPHLQDIGTESTKVQMKEIEKSLIITRLIEFTFNRKDGKGMGVNFLCQLTPKMVTSSALNNLIVALTDEPFERRFMEVLAGQKRLFSDLLFARDVLKKRKKALKNDDTGLIYEMMVKNKSSLISRIFGFDIDLSKRKTNTATSILMYEANTFNTACKKAGVNFDKPKERQEFFNKTAALFIVVVDTYNAVIDVYANGLEQVGTYPFKMFEQAKAMGSGDMKSTMQLIASGMMPQRF